MQLKYVKPYKVPLLASKGGKKTLTYLLWGDPVFVKDTNTSRGVWLEVMARNHDKGFLKRSDLMDESILEIYFIDVGQGDGVLMKTPDNKWHLIDAGTTNDLQMTGRGAANFVRFKFIEDLRMDKVKLENLIMTHPDLDHYGGMIDLLSGKLGDWDPFKVEVTNFYHNGMGDYTTKVGMGDVLPPGQIADFPINSYRFDKTPRLISPLLDNAADFKSQAGKFGKRFRDFAKQLLSKSPNISRLHRGSKHLPGYGDDNADIKIHVLGPIVEQYTTGESGLRVLEGNESKTKNGHSIILRVDYKNARILLTGDLNKESQKLLLNYVPKEEFKADIAKGCHHGSEDILFDFLKHMNPKATIISSGDNEKYSHPRPLILGASAFHGSTFKGEDETIDLPPLVYSTELARSVQFDTPLRIKTRSNPDDSTYDDHEVYNTLVTMPGRKNPKRMADALIVNGLNYGLISVRTDGNKILIANAYEGKADFETQVISLKK